MKTVSTTELRTKTKELVKTLKEGKSVDLIHRSRVIGIFKPVFESKKVLSDKELKEIEVLLTKIRPQKLIPENKREEIYRAKLKKEYGQSISRHKRPNRYLGA